MAKSKFAFKLLRWFCPKHLYEEIEGDLIQRFNKDVKLVGEQSANRRLILNAIRFFRPGILLRNKFSKTFNTTMMLKNYFTVAWRSFLKRKTLSTINVLGISFGISFSMIALLFIKDEFSFDSFHKNKELIYRVDEAIHNSTDSTSSRISYHPIPLAPLLKDEVSGVDYATRYDQSQMPLLADKNKFVETIYFVDADFPVMFTIEYIQGSREGALRNQNAVMISAGKAQKFFGTINAIGKIIEINNRPFIVSSVFKAFPQNTSLDPELIVRYENFMPYQNQRDDWGASYSPVFIQLKPTVKPDNLYEQLNRISNEKLFKSQFENRTLSLTRLDEIHFDSEMKWLNVSNMNYSYILAAIAITLLLVACINYILLSLAGSLSRTKEIGVRKVMGATRKMIRFQFIGESMIIVLLSVCFSFMIVYAVLPLVNDFMNKQLTIFQWTGFDWLILFSCIIGIVGVLAGGYPALILSNLIPRKILAGSGGDAKVKFSAYLIVFQFATCFVLLVSSLVMVSQMNLIQTKNLGFSKEQIIAVDAMNDAGIQGSTILENFRAELADEPDILYVSGISPSFGSMGGSQGRTDETGKKIISYNSRVDYDFFEMMDIKLKEGRFFSRDLEDRNATVVNESFAHQLGEDSAIGKKIFGREIIGVVHDFNFEPLNFEIKAIAFSMGGNREILIKINPTNIPQTISKLDDTWAKIVGEGHLKFQFLDEQINSRYIRYKQWLQITSISALLVIVIAGLGLLGMVGLTVINRTKEIGIRKVLGAPIRSILVLFSNQYIRMIVLAFICAIPIANYFTSFWLEDFAYKTDVGVWHYILPLMLVVSFALLIITSQVIKTAKTNPIDSLKYE